MNVNVDAVGTLRAVFIRAPAIVKVWGDTKPLAKLRHPRVGEVIVAAQENAMLATVFHPELTTTAMHKHLLELARGKA